MRLVTTTGRALAAAALAPLAAQALPVTGLEAIPAPLSSVYLRWFDTTDNETGFLVERGPPGGPYAALATLPPDVTVHTDTGLEPDTAYTYRVVALVAGNTAGTTIATRTLPRWSVRAPTPVVSVAAPDTLAVSFTGTRATCTVEESADLAAWAPAGPPVFLDAGTAHELTRPLQAGFLRVASRAYERPQAIGLSIPFELPPEPDGDVWDVTLFGATPSTISATNDDAVGILTAISIARPGDVILIPAGTYTIRRVLQLPSGVTLRGAGMDATVLVTENIGNAVLVPPEASDIRIEHFAITYLGATEQLLNGVYVGSSRTGANSRRIVIDSLKIERFSVMGVALRDCHHVLVQNCRILNATNLGDGGHGYGIALNYPTNHDNWIRNNTIGPVIRHAILLQYYCHNNLVEHNLAYGNSEDAYDLHGEDEYANELRFNTARDCDRDGFGVGNTGATHDRSGPDNWIHHNTVERCLHGIEVIQDSDMVYIDENTFADNQYGIRVHSLGGNHLYLRGNTIRGNQTGISVTTSRWVWLTGNRIEDQSLYGIEILGGVQDLVQQGNTFAGNKLDYRP